MSKHSAPLLALTLLAACLLYVPLPSHAANRTIIVPDDYPTISSAIENAVAGDTITVKTGNYREESINISKSISLIGEGIENTILSLNPPLVQTWLFYNLLWIRATAITINAGNVKLEGFTINLPGDELGISSAIHAIGDGITIIDNMVGNSSVYLSGSKLNVTGNSIPEALEVVGSNLIISNNTVGKTLKVQGFYSLVSYNQIGNNYYWNGIQFNGSYNCILGNSFSTMEIEDSNSNFIVSNAFAGLSLGGCSDNVISKNRVTGSGVVNDGISLAEGKNNTFSANSICNCENGLTLGTAGSTAVGNWIYLNNFVNNTNHVVCLSGSNHTVNHFDNGSKGNYFDNYRGNDSNRDGVGDSPYTVQETHWDEELQHDVTIVFFQDNYPLMAPFDIDTLQVDLPDWAGTIDNSGSKPLLSVPVLAVVIAIIIVAGAGFLFFRKRAKGRTQ